MCRVDYSDEALLDLQDIYNHIAIVLREPGIAMGQTDRIMDAVDSLDIFPLRYRLYDKEPWRSMGLRVMPVDNYIVFYLADEEKGLVTIVRIMHGSRDIEKHLGEPGPHNVNGVNHR